MAAKAEDALPISAAAAPQVDSDPGPDPPARVAKGAEEEEEEEEREDPPRESKRRRTCPAALETTPSPAAAAAVAAKVEDREEEGSSGAARGEVSFSFDTRGFVSPVETTPKFGCFRFPVPDLDTTTAAAEAEAVAETTAEVGGAEDEHDADENQIGNN